MRLVAWRRGLDIPRGVGIPSTSAGAALKDLTGGNSVGVSGKGEPQPLYRKLSSGERVRATKGDALGWRLRIRDPKRTGSQPERSFYGTYKAAVIELSKMEEKLARGEMLPLRKGPLTIADAAELWLDAYRWSGRISTTHSGKPNRPYSTWSKAKVQVRTYILPRIGPDVRVSALSKRDVERVLTQMKEDGYKPASILTTVSVLKSLFRDLEILEITPTNYAAGVSGNWTTNLEKSPASLKIPSINELYDVTMALDRNWPGHGFIIMALASTGLRWAEFAALEWRDIDFEKKIIMVRRSATESGGRRSVSNQLKSRSSRRNIILIQNAEGALTRLNRVRLENKAKYPQYNWDRIVNGTRGGYISYKTWQRHLQVAKRECESDITAHDLRHTFASLLFAQNESVQLISEMMGHSSSRITEKTYIHLINRSREEDAKRINSKRFFQP